MDSPLLAADKGNTKLNKSRYVDAGTLGLPSLHTSSTPSSPESGKSTYRQPVKQVVTIWAPVRATTALVGTILILCVIIASLATVGWQTLEWSPVSLNVVDVNSPLKLTASFGLWRWRYDEIYSNGDSISYGDYFMTGDYITTFFNETSNSDPKCLNDLLLASRLSFIILLIEALFAIAAVVVSIIYRVNASKAYTNHNNIFYNPKPRVTTFIFVCIIIALSSVVVVIYSIVACRPAIAHFPNNGGIPTVTPTAAPEFRTGYFSIGYSLYISIVTVPLCIVCMIALRRPRVTVEYERSSPKSSLSPKASNHWLRPNRFNRSNQDPDNLVLPINHPPALTFSEPSPRIASTFSSYGNSMGSFGERFLYRPPKVGSPHFETV